MIGERLRWLRTKCSRLFRRGRHEAALDAELQFHLDQLVAQYRNEGMSEDEAGLAARREFGEISAYREEIRDAWRPPELADAWRALRFAVRSLSRSPGFTALAILMLALGIGGNTVMFSGFDTLQLKPLPYGDSAQLDRIERATALEPEGPISPADVRDLRAQADSYGDVAAFAAGEASLAEPGQHAEMALVGRVTVNFLATLQVKPQLGRDFLQGEDVPGSDRVVIIGQRCWQNRFGGRADAIGRTIRIDGIPHEVVGVLPASFNDWRHLGAIDLYRPLALDPQQSADRRNTFLLVIGRRSGKLSGAEARGLIARVGERLANEFPDVNAGSTWRAVPLNEAVLGSNGRNILAMLIGLSGLVLLIACSNLANLLLARTMARAREFAVRSALGASRSQLLRPLILESVLLALAGGACAMIVARWGADWLSARSMADNGERIVFDFDWRVFGWAFGASLVTAVAFGLAPALFALRLNLIETLRNGGQGATVGRGHQRFRNALIVGQFALAMVLLAGAGLFIRGLDGLIHRRAGWDSDRVVTATVALPAAYPDPDSISAFQRRTVERLESLPGVVSASISSFAPFFEWPDVRRYVALGQELPERGYEPAARVNGVTPGYFGTFGTRLLAGRVFDERDTADAPTVFMINQAMATALFGDDDPIGRRLLQVGGDARRTGAIIGVVADVKSVLPNPGPGTFQLYQPMAQEPRRDWQIAVRTVGVTPATVVESIRKLMTELDPDLPVRKLQTADATIDRAVYTLGVMRDLLSAFAVLGLGLASLGVYGVIARTMAQRSREFAIRFALGAGVRDVTWIVLASGLKLALAGSAIGLLGAVGVARVLAAHYSGMRLDAPPVLVGTTLLLIAVAVVACWLPALRAARIQPAEALRAE